MPWSGILKLAESSEGFSKIKDALACGEKVIRISGLAGSGKALLLAHLKKNLPLPFLVITSKPEEALKIYDDLVSFLGQEKTRLFPAWEILPYEMKIPDPEIIGRRVETLYDLALMKNIIALATVRSCLEKTMLPEDLKKKSIRLKVGESTDIENLSQQLFDLGFKRFPQVEEVGAYSMRGGIVDVFPHSYSDPIRIEFFGDQIESILKFAVLDQR